MRKCLVPIAFLCALPAFAQAPLHAPAQVPVERDAKADPRQNQKIEHLRVEDRSNRIDEVRVGGQSMSVKVTPKSGAPAYELQPSDLAHSRAPVGGDSFSDRPQRVWNVLGF
ncbi:MAG: hypothetical protein KGL68_15565 [Burkholderiales bacterium]|nr:hypothetical protein [Burkholderiales bacterium]